MKESKEALLALVVLGKFVSDRLKDGVQLDDALALGAALTADGKFKDVVMAGYKDMDKVSEEFKDFSLAKALDLLSVLPEILEVLKK